MRSPLSYLGRSAPSWLVVLISVLFCGCIIGVWWHLDSLSQNLVETAARQEAALESRLLEEFRTLYTKEVVENVRPLGIKVSHEYHNKVGTIPLPASFTIDLSKHIDAKEPNFRVRLYSDHPFPWRVDGNSLDSFEREALAYLKQHPHEAFARLEMYKGRPAYRYATADIMRPQCVQCHNSHPASPKTDWKTGDVRGVLEVIRPLDPIVAQTRSNLQGTFTLVGGLAVLGIFCIGLVVTRLRRTSHEMEQQVLKRTAELTRANEELKQTAEELQSAKRDAESANVAKSEFLAHVSHEIRTPITAILGFSDLLEGANKAPEEHRFSIHSIHRNALYLLQIINDILDLSKIEAGKPDIRLEACSLLELIAETISLLQVRAEGEGLSLSVEYVGSVPRIIRTDPVRLRQILINLMGNAVKFTEYGSIRLMVRCIRGQPGDRLQLDVMDTGVGISKAKQQQLFQSFTPLTSTGEGTGLGLVICRRLAQLLHGDVTVVSEVGKGSTFTVTIGIEIPDDSDMIVNVPPESGSSGEAPLGGAEPKLACRILLAEDGPDNQFLISRVLRRAGAEVTVVNDGQQACEQALAAEQDMNPYSVILMDMQMPVKDGYDATRELRQNGFARPIIALTAHAMTEDRQKCLAAGCNEYLTKPVDHPKLIQIIARFVPDSVIASGDSSNEPTTPKSDESPPDQRKAMAGHIDARLAELQSYGGNEFIAEIIRMFRLTADKLVEEAEGGMRKGDLTSVQHATHSLRSSAGNIGAHSLQELASRIEQLAAANQAESIPFLLREVDQVLGCVKGILDEKNDALGR